MQSNLDANFLGEVVTSQAVLDHLVGNRIGREGWKTNPYPCQIWKYSVDITVVPHLLVFCCHNIRMTMKPSKMFISLKRFLAIVFPYQVSSSSDLK